ncbi:Gluconeogenesis factor [Streptomyces badius]
MTGRNLRMRRLSRATSALSGRKRGAQPKVVALGGGMGLSASLTALRRIAGDLTAVVTVADDGGSSGRLREELGVLPPGDLRKALAALCGDDDWGRTWSQVVQHRFESKGDLHGHAVGNLLIVALWEQLGDHVQALDLVGKLLGAHGLGAADVGGPAGAPGAGQGAMTRICPDAIVAVRESAARPPWPRSPGQLRTARDGRQARPDLVAGAATSLGADGHSAAVARPRRTSVPRPPGPTSRRAKRWPVPLLASTGHRRIRWRVGALSMSLPGPRRGRVGSGRGHPYTTRRVENRRT